jgi:hypothetical protein
MCKAREIAGRGDHAHAAGRRGPGNEQKAEYA